MGTVGDGGGACRGPAQRYGHSVTATCVQQPSPSPQRRRAAGAPSRATRTWRCGRGEDRENREEDGGRDALPSTFRTSRCSFAAPAEVDARAVAQLE